MANRFCRGIGHMVTECPNRQVITIMENPGEEETKEPPGEPIRDVEEEYVDEPDEGELLVIRKSLNANVVAEEVDPREKIFQTRCAVQGKVYQVIIDSGSCTNVASTIMVEKLRLPTNPHPRPYKLQRLSKESIVRATKQILVSLSIGKNYQDIVTCDVVPMDACHLLLGRPWLFDRHVTNDGFKNTYSIILDQKKITLLPLSTTTAIPSSEQESSSTRIELTEAIHGERRIYMLMLFEEGEEHATTISP
ncbi:hypothetical protein MLD38_021328 [Melastoma candidum]|uniref:Uncharacterized protein n=1 Tax=Melastoma candidum TaxID=119954 RepID=A0ACB9QFT4_9MYRT|nr:hypothetical protein MLD38_021328 [Melastoma candidum]